MRASVHVCLPLCLYTYRYVCMYILAYEYRRSCIVLAESVPRVQRVTEKNKKRFLPNVLRTTALTFVDVPPSVGPIVQQASIQQMQHSIPQTSFHRSALASIRLSGIIKASLGSYHNRFTISHDTQDPTRPNATRHDPNTSLLHSLPTVNHQTHTSATKYLHICTYIQTHSSDAIAHMMTSLHESFEWQDVRMLDRAFQLQTDYKCRCNVCWRTLGKCWWRKLQLKHLHCEWMYIHMCVCVLRKTHS